ncbi:MAG TPA: UDP-N-acetylmuramoyl-L-alanine--D-glutamate ligase [Candidatus Saccharibacteria bacterium]|nr:UDP-N-acetylmuramoyl-L-alanine--D-glutamate ligase [Candidatus Saccharibacteria bacterium]
MRIAIAGFGKEGRANYDYWNTPDNELTIVDEREQLTDLPTGAATILGEGAFGKLAEFDMVVRTASLRPDKIVTNGKIWSATNEFFAKCEAPIIGVTGTKGKGTTCSLIASILRAAGKTVHLVGNIGVPALAELNNIQATDIVVFEASSFQLWDIEKSPQTAVVLKVEQDHMDVHHGMEEYITAKAQIVRYMTSDQTVYYHPTYQFSRRIATMYETAKAKRYGIKDDSAAYVSDGSFMQNDAVICSLKTMQIPGEHNIENACAAISASLEYTQDFQAIEQGLRNFDGLPHRLKFIREVNGVRYFDDSYSSAPAAAIAAVRAHSEPQIILLGGYDKGASYEELAREIKQSSVKHAVLYGQTRQAIRDALVGAGLSDGTSFSVLDSTNFEEIVNFAVSKAEPGDVVVLSPACASFDMFTNFTERGEKFIAIVEEL